MFFTMGFVPEIKYLVSCISSILYLAFCILYLVSLVSSILAKAYVLVTTIAYDITKAYEKRLFSF